MKKFLLTSLFIIFCGTILALSVRGISGNPKVDEFSKLYWRDDGPLELSPERGRFALLYSIVEDKSFKFSLPLARFVVPDVGFLNGNYVSLFPPGVSFFAIPGYLIGKTLGAAQVGAFATSAFFALLNGVLIYAIGKKLGASQIAAAIGTLTFLFATPAFAYSVTLYQHQITVFFLLAAIYTLLRWNNLLSLSLVWFFYGTAFLFDYPNAILILPVALFALGRIIFFKKESGRLKINIKLAGFLTFLTVILPLTFFVWYNLAAYNNPFRLSQTVTGVRVINESGLPVRPDGQTPVQIRKKNPIDFLQTRHILNGLDTHFASLDRGVITYAPVILFGVLGMPFLYKKNQKVLTLLLSIVVVNVLFYSMWGDPYGGWAFGSRYLIPSYAVMSILVGVILTQWRKNTLFSLLFLIVVSYSVAINTLGAITSNANPPKVEAIPLSQIAGVQEKYTYERNFDYLKNKGSKSFFFQTFANKYLTAWQYYLIITTSIVSFTALMLLYLRLFLKGGKV